MTSLNDKEAILKIRNGEIDYYSVIVGKYIKIINKYISGRLFDKNDADDLTQNTFINFYKAINRFDTEKPALPYLYQIAKNELKMYFRSHGPTVGLDDKIEVETNIKLPLSDDSTVIRELLPLLPQDQKSALSLLGNGYSYREIAKKLNKPLNTVRTIIRRGRLKLKEYYEKTGK